MKTTYRMAASVFAAILVYLTPVQGIDVSARSAVVLDGDSGRVLWEQNSQEESLIASTTKIMTALVVLEQAELEDRIEVPPEAVGVEGSSMYLTAGEMLTVEDLLYGMMLSSGNDAAVALAIHVSGSSEEFAGEMNRRARELGLAHTGFANPNGLDQEGNYSTAEDLGHLAAAAMANSDFRRIVSTKTYQCPGHTMTNHNKLLWQYEGAVGVKTGFTKKAGRILVGSAERNGRRLISVTIHAPEDWQDHRRLLDYGFSQYSIQTLVEENQQVGTLPVMSGQEESVSLLAAEGLRFSVLPGETPEYRLLTRPFLYAPVEEGETLGTLQLYLNQRLMGQMPVYAGKQVEAQPQPPTLWQRLHGIIFGEGKVCAGACAKDSCP